MIPPAVSDKFFDFLPFQKEKGLEVYLLTIGIFIKELSADCKWKPEQCAIDRQLFQVIGPASLKRSGADDLRKSEMFFLSVAGPDQPHIKVRTGSF